jgi:hypothetical protein
MIIASFSIYQGFGFGIAEDSVGPNTPLVE